MRAKVWKLWAMSLGEKASEDSKDADLVATIRTFIVVINVVCAILIMTNIVHNW